MPDYAKLAQTANRLVTESGRTIQLVKSPTQLADDDEPWNGPPSVIEGEVSVTVPAVQLLPAAVRIFGLAALGESTEFRGLVTYSELVYVIFQGEQPLQDFTTVIDNGVRYQIQATQSLKPADTTLLGFIGVRR